MTFYPTKMKWMSYKKCATEWRKSLQYQPKKSGTNSGTSGFKFPSSLACSAFVLFALFGSDSDCIEAFKGIRKFLGVGGGGTHVSVADAMIGTIGIP